MADTSTKQGSMDMPAFDDILKAIQFEDPREVGKKETGKRIAERIYREQSAQKNNLNFFSGRAIRWNELLRWAQGRQDMSQFLPMFNVAEGNKAYIPLPMTPIMVGPQFVNTLVTSMSSNEEYACVSAVDGGSVNEKEDRKREALYRMQEIETIAKLQEEAGVAFESPTAYVPDNELAADVYFQLEDRLPKEMRFEQRLAEVLRRSQYDRVLKPKLIFDNVVHNIEVTKIENDTYGRCIKRCIPQNVFYSFFTNDSGQLELGYIGDVYKLKVRDLRSKYRNLTEKEIYDIAKTSSQTNAGTWLNTEWKEEYATYNHNCPWDDHAVLIYEFEINISINEYHVGKKDAYGKENIAPKNGVPSPTSDKATVYGKKKERWYRCVYSPMANKVLYWGLPSVVILPQDDTSCSLSSYTINIPNNTGEYVPSLFERAMEPLEEYCLVKLKIKQLIMKLRPSGIRIDVESARNVDLGDGNTIGWEQIQRIYDQTGNELWSSKGIDPNQREAPAISPGTVVDDVQKIIALEQRSQGLLAEIRNLLGVPTYRDGGDVGDRTAAKLAEIQSTNSFNVTDFIQNSHNQVMEETLYKVCLIEWAEIVKNEPESEEDLINTKFQVEVKMKQTAYEKQLLEQDIQIWSKVVDPQTGKPALSPKDVYKLRNIKNHKMAEAYLASIFDDNDKKAQQRSMQLQQQNAEVQAQAAQQKSEADAQMLEMQLKMQEYLANMQSREKKEQELLKMVGAMHQAMMTPQTKSADGTTSAKPELPKGFEQVASVALENVVGPMVQENIQQSQPPPMQ